MKKRICTVGFIFLISVSSLFARMNLKFQMDFGPLFEYDSNTENCDDCECDVQSPFIYPQLGIYADYDFTVNEKDFFSVGFGLNGFLAPGAAFSFSYIKCLKNNSDAYKKWYIEPKIYLGMNFTVSEVSEAYSDKIKTDWDFFPFVRLETKFVKRPEKNGFIFGVGPAVSAIFCFDKAVIWSPELSFSLGYRF